MKQELIPTTTLLPRDLRDKVEESAKRNYRKLSTEIVHVLAQHYNDEADLREATK